MPKPGVVVDACNPSSWRVEVRASGVQGHPLLLSEFRFSPVYIRSCLQQTREWVFVCVCVCSVCLSVLSCLNILNQGHVYACVRTGNSLLQYHSLLTSTLILSFETVSHWPGIHPWIQRNQQNYSFKNINPTQLYMNAQITVLKTWIFPSKLGWLARESPRGLLPSSAFLVLGLLHPAF